MGQTIENIPKTDVQFEDDLLRMMHKQVDSLIDYIVSARVGYEIERRRNLEAKILNFRSKLVPNTDNDILQARLLEEFDNHFGITSKR